MEKAERVVIVGGGSAGVEMAAEVKTTYPNKEVQSNILLLIRSHLVLKIKIPYYLESIETK